MREFFRSFISSFNTSLDLQARALGVTRRRLVAINMWFWIFLVALVLLPCGARAQVAGLCGPGKNCKVRSLTASAGVTSATLTTSSNVSLGSGCLLVTPSGSGVQVNCQMLFGTNQNLTMGANGTISASTGTVTAGLGFAGSSAFASFPVAAAGNTGRLLYDSTNGWWRMSTGTVWMVLHQRAVDTNITYAPAAGITVNTPFSLWTLGGAYGASAKGEANASGVVVTVGVGAGDAVFTLWDETSAATTGLTLTCGCSTLAVGGTCTVGGAPVLVLHDNVAYGWRLTTDCAGTRPVLNLTFSHTQRAY